MTKKINPVARIPELKLEEVGHGEAFVSLDASPG